MTTPNTRSETEKWLEGLGMRFRQVWFLTPNGWLEESHVDDPETFDTTVDTSRQRLRARYVLYPYEGKWVLIGGRCGYAKDYPTREAAEMVAIHNA